MDKQGTTDQSTGWQRVAALVQYPAELYETLLNTQSDLGVGLLIVARENIVYANAAACTLLGYSGAELGALRWPEDVMHSPDDDQAVRSRSADAATRYETRLRRKDGTQAEVEIAAKPVVLSGQQQVVYLVSDIGERKRGQESQSRLASIVQSSDDAIISTDRARIVTSWNRGAEELYGYSAAESVGKPTVARLVPPHLAEESLAIRERVLRGERLDHFETERVRKDGALIAVSLTMSPVFDAQGAIVGIASIARDITERKRSEDALKRQAKEFAALYETARALATEQDLPALLRAIVAQATTLLNAPVGTILLYEPDTRELVLYLTKGTPSKIGTRMKLGEGMAGRVAQTLAPLLVDSYQQWSQRSAQMEDADLGAVVQVPMLYGGELIGVLSVSDFAGTARTFNETDARLLTLLAGHAASAVHNARLLDETRRKAEHLQAVADVERAATTILEPASLLAHISSVLRKRLNLYGAGIALVEGDELVFNGGSRDDGVTGGPELRLRIGQEGISGRVAASGKSEMVPDVLLDSRFVRSEYLPLTRSELAVPLKTNSGVIGVLNIESDQPNAFPPELVMLVETLASQVALSIENARLFDAMRQLARTDVLTGVPNRRDLFEQGERELSRARRFSHPLSAIMLDIDRFKRVNDTHGHRLGDRVLQAVAKCCLSHIRDIDMLGRYGGEEFVLLLVQTELAGAQSLAERLRASVAALEIPSGSGPVQVTISAGVAQASEHDSDLAALLARADKGLYAAKHAGRNRTEVAD